MATNGGAVDALQRELIKAGKKRKVSMKDRDKSQPSKRYLAKLERQLKG